MPTPDAAGFPYFELQFTKHGRLARPSGPRKLLDHLRDAHPSDLLVLSHGWNNDMAEARALYGELLANLRQRLSVEPKAQGRSYTAVGLLWPSKKFADRDLIPGGAASIGESQDVPEAQVQKRLGELHGAFDARGANAKLKQAQELVGKLDRPEAQDAFVELVRGLMPPGEMEEDEVPDALFEDRGRDVIASLAQPEAPERPAVRAGMGGAGGIGPPGGRPRGDTAGSAAGLGSLLKGARSGAMRLLNYVTYYQMKARAGEVARTGVAPLLDAVLDAHPALRIHLVGHSFGGRLVTATASALRAGHEAASMSLLQAAFSHHGLTENYEGDRDGAFCNIVREHKVHGPIVITHTANDKAVGYAYPIASRLARQAASALGDADDRYGGMGRNGAQRLGARTERLRRASHGYTFAPRTIYNLLADDHVSDHGDVANPAVANAVAHAVLTS